jgi:hypothetical protein
VRRLLHEPAHFIGGAPQLKNKNIIFNTAKVRIALELAFGRTPTRFLISNLSPCTPTTATLFKQDERIRISSTPVGTIHLDLDVMLRNFASHDVQWE